jgi:carboxymethylenebutenolidase
VRQIEAKLGELGKDFRLKIYAGAAHGFFNEERPSVYHPEAAGDAWNELKRFFATHLKGAV